jgi:SOS response regulatory protein OraA/RecX
MRKINTTLVTVLSLIIISGVVFNTTIFASSLNSTRQVNRSTVSEIPKSVLRNARVFSEASVLNKTDTQLHSILMSHNLHQVLSKQGLSKKAFREDVRAEMTSYLISKGFTQSQITAALNSRYIKSHRNNI